MSLMLEPPASLPVDETHGIYRALLLRWDEPAAEFAEDPGRVFRFGDVAQPKVKESCKVNYDHDRRDEAGVVVATCSDRHGLWASLKLGKVARGLVARGHRAVSVEIDNGVLSGVALLTARGNEPAYPSAQILVDGYVAPPVPDVKLGLLEQVVALADVSGGRVLLDPQPVPKPAGWDLSGPAHVVDAGRARQEAHSWSMTAIHEDVEFHRARFEERRAAFAQQADQHEEDLLRQAMVPVPLWPHHTAGWQSWRAFEDQLEAERAAERRRVEAAGIRELVDRWHAREITPAVETRERPSWWSRLLHRPR